MTASREGLPSPTIDWEAFYRNYRKPGFVAGYEISSKLGGGMFGLVFRARKQSIGKDYAIKFLKVDDDEVRQAVLAELESVRHFAQVDHPNLVAIEDRGEVVGIPYIVMTYAGDRTLRDLLTAATEPDQLVRYFLQACRGLQALHDHSLVHFDVKPANIFIRGSVARVGDYGLSKLVAHSRNTLSMGRGTPYYMAPEMLQRKGDVRSDIYSLGVILFECLTGDVPFKGDSEWEVLRKHESAAPEFPDTVAPAHRSVLERCLAKDPDARYQRVADLLEALVGVPAGAPRWTASPAPPSGASSPSPSDATGEEPEEDLYGGLRSAAKAFTVEARNMALEAAKAARAAVNDPRVRSKWRCAADGGARRFRETCVRLRRRSWRNWRVGVGRVKARSRRVGSRIVWSVAAVGLVVGVMAVAFALIMAPNDRRRDRAMAAATRAHALGQAMISSAVSSPSPDWLQMARLGDPYDGVLGEHLASFGASLQSPSGSAVLREVFQRVRPPLPGLDVGVPSAKLEVAQRAASALAETKRYDLARVAALRQHGHAGVVAAVLELGSRDLLDDTALEGAANVHRFLQEELHYFAIHLHTGQLARDPVTAAANARVAEAWTRFVRAFVSDQEAFTFYTRSRR